MSCLFELKTYYLLIFNHTDITSKSQKFFSIIEDFYQSLEKKHNVFRAIHLNKV